MADLQGGQTYINVLPSMAGYFKRVRAEIKGHPVDHKIGVEVDQRKLVKAKSDLDSATKAAADARRRESAATKEAADAERQLQALRSKGVTDASRLAAAEAKVAKAKRDSQAAAAALNAAESKRTSAANRVVHIETRIDDKRAEADSASLLQRLTQRFGAGGQAAGAQFVSGVSASMNSHARGSEEGRSFVAGFFSAIGSGMRAAVAGFAILSTAATSVIRNVGTAATVLGFAARAVRNLSVGLLASTSLLRMMTGAGVARLAGALRLAATAAGILARDIGRVTAALLVMAGVAKLVGILTRIGRALGVVTVGSAVALGAVSALGSVVATFATGPMVSGLMAIAAAMGTVAAAAAGILGPAIGVAKLAFAGLSDGAKAWTDSQKNVGAAASKSASALKAVENAKKAQARTAEQGNRQIVSAEKQVVKAQEAVKEAQDEVNQARKEAKRDAEGYARTLAGLALDEEGAALALAEAEKNLRETRANPDADGLDRWRAELGVREAKQAFEEIKATSAEQRAEIADAQAKGIEGSDRVVEAKEREVDAQEQLREAQSDLAQTQKDVAQANIDAAEAVADAYQSMADAQQSAAGDDPFAAMIGQRLAPLLQAFKNLREELTDRFSLAMVGSFTMLGGLLDRLKPNLGGLAATLGTIGAQIATSISSPAAVAGWDRMIAGSRTFFDSLAQGENGLGSVFSGLISVLGTAAETFAHTGAGLNEWLLGLGEKLRNISADDLRSSLDGVRQTFENIGAVVGPLFELFRGFGAEAAAGLAPGFVALGQSIKDSIPGLMDMARVLMPALGQALANLAPVLPGLVEAFRPWSDVLAAVAPHLGTIIEKLAPLAPMLLAAVMAVKVIGVAMTAWNAVMFASSVAQGVFAAATGRSAMSLRRNTIALAAHRAALVAGAVAQWALNAAMSANPITLLVIAIAALVGALVWFFTQTETGKRIWETVWSGIQAALSAAWEFIRPIFEAIGAIFVWLYENVVQPVFTAIKVALAVVAAAFILMGQVVMGIWNTLVTFLKTYWDNVGSKIFDAIKVALQAVGAFFGWVWNSLIKPAWEAFGAGIAWVWENVIRPAWEALKAALGAVGEFFSSVWNSVIKPVWDALGAGIKAVIDNVVTPAWEAMKTALGKVRDFFSEVVKGIGEKWDSLKSVLAKPINFMINTVWNEGILKAWNKAAGLLGLGPAEPLAGIPEHATGGAIRGPGTGTSDDVLMWGSNGEHMVTTAEVKAAGGHNVLYAIRDMILRGIPFQWNGGRIISQIGRDNLNAYGAQVAAKGLGNVDPQGMFNGILPGYKDGGEIRPMWQTQLENGHRAAKSRNGNPYTWGFEDCSGLMSMIADAIINGGNGSRNWFTGSFPGTQPWTPGLGQGFSVGVWDDPGGPGGGHTAGTLTGVGGYSTVNVESSGSGGVMYGGGAIGADSPYFAGKHPGLFHLAIGADGAFESGGAGGGGGLSPEGKQSFVQRKVADIFDFFLNPITAGIGAAIGAPPPEWVGVPPAYLDKGRDMTSRFLSDKVAGLGDLLGSVWDKAKNIGGLFRDKGGWIPNGLSLVRNETGRPEAVLNWEQIKLIKDLLLGGDIAGALSAMGMLNNAPAAAQTSEYGSGQQPEVGPAAAAKYAAEIDWGGVGAQIGTSLLAEWGNDLLGIAGFSSQFEGMKLVDDRGRGRSDEAQARNEATYSEAPAAAATPASTGAPESTVDAPATAEVAAGPESVVDAVKRAFAPYGWNEGEQWAAADWIIQKESSWNPLARNPQSSAFSLFQFLGSTKDAYLPDESPDPYTQGVAGAKYIRDRYGDPIRAKSFWEKNGYYDQGGIASGRGFMLKDVIRPERVLSPRQTEAFEALVPMLDRVQSAASAPREVMSAADRSALELAPVGGGDNWNFNGELSPAMRREIDIMWNQRERGSGRSSESRRRW
ncbi:MULTISPECIES: hypothetical protein [Rhodococcus]|uniref:aggregation-promoting factor C-terminal-like domain-containing protein n=1 Tax=Rhodococcus TaxID=1827 RepID=UPI00143EA1C7|nr:MULTISPECIES: hypothetical protein [Rhodococcus]QIX48943.1 hypothetical protein HFP48_04810 [Rhodococcus sp. DMU1]QRI76006.1 hypothetical protein JQ505_26620 [Rhodococcus aetherivorans]QSE59417.1 hypothetical protein JYA75_27720 [Rhodococcus sp. PSBB066]QSE69258.1 hypothetical protein JYA91_27735 [Rhodococcus sp. PSBB049]